jgi:hypothetical protein
VEAFRAALTRSAQQVGLKIPSTGSMVVRPRLDIERLLGHAPELPADMAHAPATIRHGNQR